MKIFLITQTANTNWSTYDGAVVAAPDEDTASRMHPEDGELDKWKGSRPYPEGEDWCSCKEEVKVTYLGEAFPGMPQGVVLSSFTDH